MWVSSIKPLFTRHMSSSFVSDFWKGSVVAGGQIWWIRWMVKSTSIRWILSLLKPLCEQVHRHGEKWIQLFVLQTRYFLTNFLSADPNGCHNQPKTNATTFFTDRCEFASLGVEQPASIHYKRSAFNLAWLWWIQVSSIVIKRRKNFVLFYLKRAKLS